MYNLHNYSCKYKQEQFLNLQEPGELAKCLKINDSQMVAYCTNSSFGNFTQPKKSGGVRIIHIPGTDLKVVLKQLNFYLYPIYRNIKEGRGFYNIKDHAQIHASKNHILSIDIKDFFSTIKATHIKKVFTSAPFVMSEQVASALALFCSHQGFLPTGSPVSPVLANFVFLRGDIALTHYATMHKLSYSRYADDLTFSSDAFIPKERLNEIEAIIHRFGFDLNKRKTRFISKHKRQVVTGLVVNQKANVSRKYIRNIRAVLHCIESKGMLQAADRYQRENPHKNISKGTDCIYSSAQIEYKRCVNFIEIIRGKIDFIGQIRGKDDDLYRKFYVKFWKICSLAETNHECL